MSQYSLGSKLSNTALLIIDMQNGVICKEGETYNAENLLNNLEYLINKAREAKIPVIFVQHNEDVGQQLAPNTPDWQIHPRLTPNVGDMRIQKRHPDSFQDTSLEDELMRLGVRRLFIGGLQTEWCIDSTVRRAYSLGFNTTVVEDGHSTMDSPDLEASKIVKHHNRIFGGGFASLKKTKEIDFE